MCSFSYIFQFTHEGWQSAWEDEEHGLQKIDINWLKHDRKFGLFKEDEKNEKQIDGVIYKRLIIKDKLWFPSPDWPTGNEIPMVDPYFHCHVFLWRPVGSWGCEVKCPRNNCPSGEKKTNICAVAVIPKQCVTLRSVVGGTICLQNYLNVMHVVMIQNVLQITTLVVFQPGKVTLFLNLINTIKVYSPLL